jgi:YVTN family beta-propeller protein
MQMKTWAIFCAVSLTAMSAPSPALRLAQTIPLPDVRGRIDHFAIDPQGNRLFLAALGNNTVEVIDLASGKRAKTVTGFSKPQGVAFLPESNRFVVASGDDGKVTFWNASTYAVEKTLPSLDDADNVRLDSATNEIYVGYGDGALAVIDAATARQIAVIKLAGHPESFQLQTQGRRIFVNVPDAKQVAVVDRDNRSVVATWAMTEFQSNFPMSLDEANHRLFVGCRQPGRLIVLDTESGRRVADLEITGDTDDLFYDAARKRIYLTCGAGFIDVVEQRDADHYSMHDRISTSPGARTAFVAPNLRILFVAVPQRGNKTAEIRCYQVE